MNHIGIFYIWSMGIGLLGGVCYYVINKLYTNKRNEQKDEIQQEDSEAYKLLLAEITQRVPPQYVNKVFNEIHNDIQEYQQELTYSCTMHAQPSKIREIIEYRINRINQNPEETESHEKHEKQELQEEETESHEINQNPEKQEKQELQEEPELDPCGVIDETQELDPCGVIDETQELDPCGVIDETQELDPCGVIDELEEEEPEEKPEEEPEEITYEVSLPEYICKLVELGRKQSNSIWDEIIPTKNPYLGRLLLSQKTGRAVVGYLDMKSSELRKLPPITTLVTKSKEGQIGVFKFRDVPLELDDELCEYLQSRYFQTHYECLKSPSKLLELFDDVFDISMATMQHNHGPSNNEPSRVLIFGQKGKLDLNPIMNELHVNQLKDTLIVHRVRLIEDLGEYISAEVFHPWDVHGRPDITQEIVEYLIRYYKLETFNLRIEKTNIWSWIDF
jgi:hypothetical protein